MADNTATPPSPSQQAQAPQPQAPPKPYEPTPGELEYLSECAKAIVAGCAAAVSAAAAPNGAEYLQFANGVKSLTDAYEAIKNGGQPSRHQGS